MPGIFGLTTGSFGFETANLGEHIYTLYHLFVTPSGGKDLGQTVGTGGLPKPALLMEPG